MWRGERASIRPLTYLFPDDTIGIALGTLGERAVVSRTATSPYFPHFFDGTEGYGGAWKVTK